VIPRVYKLEARNATLSGQTNVVVCNGREILAGSLTLQRDPFTVPHVAPPAVPPIHHKPGCSAFLPHVVVHANLWLVGVLTVRELWPTLTKAPGSAALSLCWLCTTLAVQPPSWLLEVEVLATTRRSCSALAFRDISGEKTFPMCSEGD